MLGLLRNVEMFEGLSDRELGRLVDIFEERLLEDGETLFEQGAEAKGFALVKSGFVEVRVKRRGETQDRAVVHLGSGQSVGEMSLLDGGARSATVRAVGSGTVIAWASFRALDDLCRKRPRTGYRIIRNIAADLSFRLRRQAGEA